MKNAINKVNLSGYVGAEVSYKELNNKQKVARVNLAVNEYFKDRKGEENKKTHWFLLTFWNEKAEQAQKEISKGSFITVEARLQSGSYTDKNGEKRYTTDIIVQQLEVAPQTVLSNEN